MKADKMIDEKLTDMPDDDEEEETVKLDIPWYMVNGDAAPIKAWEFFMALVQIYSMFVCPFVLVFPEVYQNYNKDEEEWVTVTPTQSMLKTLEFIVDVIWMINIALMFVKRTRHNKKL